MLACFVCFGYSGQGALALISFGNGFAVVVSRSRGGSRVAGPDFGPGLRRRPVRDAAGVLRESDVEINDRASDPDNPNRRLRRAYRVDPVELLRRSGALGTREVEAAQELRLHLERLVAGSGGGGFPRVSLSGYPAEPISDSQLRSSRKAREAQALLGAMLWPPVLWLCLGGSVRGYCEAACIDRRRGTSLMISGLQRLAVHFYGDAVTGG